jgi:phage/plasmid primase-like uncharacterized protein
MSVLNSRIVKFRAAIKAAGMVPPARVMPGKFVRFPGVGKSNGNTAGFCKLLKDGVAGIYGCHASGLSKIWHANTDRVMTPVEAAAVTREIAKAMRQAEAERKGKQEAAATKAQAIWDAAKDAPADFSYLVNKGVEAHGVRIYRGRLVVPIRINGVLASLQYLNAKGEKKFLTDGAIKGGRFEIGSITGATTIGIAEGFATAASFHEATGHPVAVAFNAGNLLSVAEDLRAKLPSIEIVVCADDDKWTDGNPGLTKATEAARAVGGLLAVPDFGANRLKGATDFNDLHQAQGLEAVRACIDRAAPPDDATAWQAPEPISTEEWTSSHLTPACVVQDYIFSDVAVLVAPGGTGKTTLQLFEAIHIVLGRPLYGLEIRKPGPVVILSAEDSREMLVARLRRIVEGMGLTPAQVEIVRRQVLISDLTGVGIRLTGIVDDMVAVGSFVDTLTKRLADIAPVLIVIDPAVSFSVGESRVNDAEQGLIEAGRRLRRELNCCIRYIHHTGKQNARDKTTDQYTGRGGSAFSDGARMVHVLQPLDAAAWRKSTGTDLEPGDSGLILARPKMSYTPPQGEILLRRSGYAFEKVESREADVMGDLRKDCEIVIAAVRGIEKPSRNALELMDLGLARQRLRDIVKHLIEEGIVEEREERKRGGLQKFLAVIGDLPKRRGYGEPSVKSAKRGKY